MTHKHVNCTDEKDSYSIANKFCLVMYILIYYIESG